MEEGFVASMTKFGTTEVLYLIRHVSHIIVPPSDITGIQFFLTNDTLTGSYNSRSFSNEDRKLRLFVCEIWKNGSDPWK
jgi:hypothetical protein